MNKIIFIINSSKIHLYIWKCIERINNEINDITILIDNKVKIKNNYSFNPIINFIDSKFSNLKTNPLDLIDIEVFCINSNIKITNKIEDLEPSDWVICEDKNYDYNLLGKYIKNGVLNLGLNENTIYLSILHKQLIALNITYNNLKSQDWQVISSVNLKNEIGLKNNFFKIFHNYPIYLVKLIKNIKKSDLDSLSECKNLQNSNKKEFQSKLKFTLYYIKLIITIFSRKIKKQKFNWKIGIEKDNILTVLKQPKKSFWADPFIIKTKSDNFHVYFEELKNDNLGKISCVELSPNLEIIKKEDILNTNYHLSFPNIFFKDNEYYMIPESSQISRLQLFKCKEFPFKWELKMNLMENIKLLDAVWVFYDNLYWIFANKIEDFEYDNNEKLYLYHSKDLFSNDWKPHVKNPIITDASSARNAGNFILNNGKLNRVSQNCKDGYGQSIVINEVKLLTVDDYIEEKIDTILPQKGYVGVHTLNEHKNIRVLDYLIKE
ncbi:glucosamine inositolphosphorylceramide transferase family protein [Yeosuana marina]|uniref:glucosamine inositolphosphorylceramide transferase family protein n=1 Tax=Yeosuana marina TaxID=1565536 RepID=UPI0030EF6E5E|tara:strand:- start:197 stop:1672 length:1476 start_codon:yes stop_codon:yes gene_type:complete